MAFVSRFKHNCDKIKILCRNGAWINTVWRNKSVCFFSFRWERYSEYIDMHTCHETAIFCQVHNESFIHRHSVIMKCQGTCFIIFRQRRNNIRFPFGLSWWIFVIIKYPCDLICIGKLISILKARIPGPKIAMSNDDMKKLVACHFNSLKSLYFQVKEPVSKVKSGGNWKKWLEQKEDFWTENWKLKLHFDWMKKLMYTAFPG